MKSLFFAFFLCAFATPTFAAPTKPILNEAALRAKTAPANAIWLEDLNLDNMTQGYGEPHAGESIGDNPLRLKGAMYPHGVGTHVVSRLTVDLKKSATRFAAMCGIDDETNGQGAARFRVTVDGQVKFDTGPLKGGDAPKFASVDLSGANTLLLEALAPNNDLGNAHADWAGALLVLTPQAFAQGDSAYPVSVPPPPAPHSKLPPFTPAPPKPQLHGPRVVGASPNKPFLFLIPATGRAPMTYRATNLPDGLTLDAKSGIISGRIKSAGTNAVTLSASNALGTATRPLSIVCGEGKLALTPPLGWNAWSVFGEDVTAKSVASQADYLISSGLAARGWNTVIVDDTWQSRRNADGSLFSNRRFGSVKALAAYVHSKGLKFGLTSAATPQTCSGYAGSAGFEEQDAKLFASWGVDYLKYDWCPESGTRNGSKPEELQTSFKKMRAALDKTDRDIVLSLVTYGFGGRVQEWGGATGANLWRTSAGLLDSWSSLEAVAFNQGGNERFAAPGKWNDPGPLMIGRFTPRNAHFSRLSPDEQKLQLSMWSIMAAPLIASCDLSQLDPNTFFPLGSALLMNDEVLDVDQDPLGTAGHLVSANNVEVWSRPLFDGTIAVGIFNRRGNGERATVRWSDLGLSGAQPVRDLWEHKDLGASTNEFAIDVPAHGAVLLKVGTPKK